MSANRRDFSISMARANILAVFIAIPLVVLQFALFTSFHGVQGTDPTWGVMPLIAVIVLGIVVHELIHASRESRLAERLGEFDLPILVITGDDDRIVPTEQSLRLADELPNAELAVIPQCGHVPQEECPGEFMQAVQGFLSGLEP